jgi:thiol:disulfide interchange protein DsbD
MAATYTAAGILAGLFGANLQALAQRPSILVGFSALFVVLALAMFGLFELQMPLVLQNRLAQLSARQRGGNWISSATMGLLSALIVGPCMAAPLAGALLYIAQSGDAYLGGLALFSLSLGMGAPLLIIGTSAGRLLPKAGPWMDAVKQLFGVILLAVAVWMLARLLSERIIWLLWAMLCLLAAGLLLRSVRQISSSWRLAGWLGVATLAGCASTLVLASATGADRPWLPLTRLNQSQSSSLHFARIKTYADLERELVAAAANHQPIMLDFYADWCVECITMARTTFTEPAIQQQLAAIRLLQADVTAMDAEDRELLRKLKVLGPPTIVFFDDGGHELPNGRLVGLVDAQDFMRHTRRIFTLADLVDDKHG